MTLDRQEDVEQARFRAIAQLIYDKEKGAEAFEDYMKIAFPYLTGKRKAQAQDAKRALEDEVKKGMLKVTPLGMPWKSKLSQRTRGQHGRNSRG